MLFLKEMRILIYLDNAATTGTKPIAVIKSNNLALHKYSSNPGRSGHSLSAGTAEAIYKCRQNIKNLVNAESESNVCFTLNCTYAINMVISGVLNEGDHLIISSLEHNAVYRPAINNKGIETDVFEVDFYDNNNTIENLKKLIKPNTRMIFVTSASNVVGRVLPLYEIGQICKNNNILFAVDGAQGVGVLDVDVNKMNIDYLCIAPHKGLYAPMGVGVLVAQKPINKVLIYGGTGVNSAEEIQPADLPERIESGTLNVPGIIATSSGVDFVKKIGIKNIYNHELGICKYAYKKLKEIGAKLYTPLPLKNEYVPLISFNLYGRTSEEIGGFLNVKGVAVRSGLHCAPLAHKQLGTIGSGTVRISPSVFNKFEEIDRMIFILKEII